jgi:hypothetical protein
MQVSRSRLARLVVVSVCAVAAGPIVLAQTRFSKLDATRFQSKLAQIETFANARSRVKSAQTTQVTDVEVNAYLKYMAADQVPVGVVNPVLKALGGGRVAGTAIVDLDAVRMQKKRGWGDPMGYLTGRLPVNARGVLSTQNGMGRFQLESADVSGVPIPKALLQELVSYYSRTPGNPSGVDMDAPFELPARIREIKVGQGSATIVQ